MSVRPRNVLGLAAALGVAWLGGLVLGEYPFEDYLSVIGGLLLGVGVVGAAAFVEEGDADPPAWVVVLAAALAVWGMWRAAWIDAGAQGKAYGLVQEHGIGPLPSVAYWSMAAAGAGALVRLIPKPRSRRAEPAPEPGAEPEAESAGE